MRNMWMMCTWHEQETEIKKIKKIMFVMLMLKKFGFVGSSGLSAYSIQSDGTQPH